MWPTRKSKALSKHDRVQLTDIFSGGKDLCRNFHMKTMFLIDEKAVDQDTCQEALENFVRSFQKVVDLHSQVY